MAGPSLVLLPVVLGYLLLYSGVGDAGLLVIFMFVKQRHLLDVLLSQTVLRTVSGTTAAFIVLQIFRLIWVGLDVPRSRWDGPGKVLLFPCRTTHERVSPKKHSFSYSYLVVGIPVGWEGCAGGMVSAGVPKKTSFSSWFSLRPRGWYDINAGDCLERGNAHLGLRGKLDAYLRTQGSDPAKYPYAYLVTAPRFLGYQFNPVSFWYLYDANKTLVGMIIEMNNTFSERHMYYLTPDDAAQLEDISTLKSGGKTQATFNQIWPKEFHMSPFNSRKGSYSLSASDPLSPGMQGVGPINTTISLISSKGHVKLVVRLLSEGATLDPYTMTSYQKLQFLATWWWVGLATFPRMVKEFGTLFFQKQLHIWFRPEPLKNTISREANATERQLEPLFRRYLHHLVEQSPAPLAVKYTPPSGIPNPQHPDNAAEAELILSGQNNGEELEFRILTPVFYTRFVHYAHDLEALFCEFRESGTIWISRPDLLPRLVVKKPSLAPLQSSDPVDYAYFKAIQRLRARPARIERPLTSSSSSPGTAATTTKVIDIRGFRISSMDGYVLREESAHARRTYRRCVLQVFLADRIALGSVRLLEVQRLVVQALLAWTIVAHLLALLD